MKHKSTFPESLPTHVVDQGVIDLLNANGFEHLHSDSMYSDYYRIVLGYGVTNDDRNEIVTYIPDEHKWLPAAEHVNLNGYAWHIDVGILHDYLSEAIEWLEQRQATAPKQNT